MGLYENLVIPYQHLKYVIHIIKVGLTYSTVKEFPEARLFLKKWVEYQEEELSPNTSDSNRSK